MNIVDNSNIDTVLQTTNEEVCVLNGGFFHKELASNGFTETDNDGFMVTLVKIGTVS